MLFYIKLFVFYISQLFLRDQVKVFHHTIELRKSGKLGIVGEAMNHRSLKALIKYHQLVKMCFLSLHCILFKNHIKCIILLLFVS